MTRAGAPLLNTTCETLVVKRARPLAKETKTAVSESTIIVRKDSAPAVPSSTISTSLLPVEVPDEIISKNRMLLIQLEQEGILEPGLVTIDPSGELRADLSSQPDPGTMAGLYPSMAAPPDMDAQIPSWIRDYLVKELNVRGQGPPKTCQVLYEGLKRSQDEPGLNASVWLTETQLSCSAINLQHAVDDIRDFVNSRIVVEDTYEKEFGMIIRTILHLVGCSLEAVPLDIQLLFDIGSQGATVKCALDDPLNKLILTYDQLIQKIEAVANGLRLRQDLQRAQPDKHHDMEDDDTASNADSAVAFCDF